MNKAKGTLIPIGGNEDKGIEENEMYTLEFIDEGILSHVVREAGGTDAKIVVIPTASSIPVEVGENYLSAFSKLGCTDVTILDIRSKEDSEKQFSIDLIKSCIGSQLMSIPSINIFVASPTSAIFNVKKPFPGSPVVDTPPYS